MARELNEKQKLFLEHLFGEANGSALKAKQLAGYSSDTPTSLVVKNLEDEILERTKKFLVENGPKAALSMISALDDPTQLGMKFKLAAAKDLLDRIGVSKTEKVEIATSNLFILPPLDENEDG